RCFGHEASYADCGRERITKPSQSIARVLLRQLGPEPLEHSVGDLTTIEREGNELVAAHSRDDVGLAKRLPQDSGHLDQRVITGGVAPRVVDHLEVVHVEVEQERSLGSVLGALELLCRNRFEAAAIEQAGQGIHERQRAQLILRSTSVGDVACGDRDAASERNYLAREPLVREWPNAWLDLRLGCFTSLRDRDQALQKRSIRRV